MRSQVETLTGFRSAPGQVRRGRPPPNAALKVTLSKRSEYSSRQFLFKRHEVKQHPWL